jgi:hypothetical protein
MFRRLSPPRFVGGGGVGVVDRFAVGDGGGVPRSWPAAGTAIRPTSAAETKAFVMAFMKFVPNAVKIGLQTLPRLWADRLQTSSVPRPIVDLLQHRAFAKFQLG